MFYQIRANTKGAFNKAFFEAEMSGLDPEYRGDFIFEVATGNIEKVSALISKYNLDILVESDYETTGYRS